MSDANDLPMTTDAESATGSTGCHCGKSGGILRAVLYTPIILIIGGLAAVATFPNLAEYATPLIGETHCSSTGMTSCSSAAMPHSCSSHGHSEQMSSPDDSAGSCPSSMTLGSGCCPHSRQAAAMAEETSADASVNSELTQATSSDSDAASTVSVDSPAVTELPADALNAVDTVQVQ